MTDISLLPEELRRKEDQLKKDAPPPARPSSSDLKFSTPTEEGEDVEVIEIDEGEVEQVLAGEPFLSKLVFRASAFLQDLKAKLFHPAVEEPAPKLPPQFFKPPVAQPGVAPAVKPIRAEAANLAINPQELAKAKVRIIPSEKAPKRVRVIRRIRKPMRVSFVSEEQLELLRINVPKRRFTFIALSVLFTVLLAGGWFALWQLQSAASSELSIADRQLSDTRKSIQEEKRAWTSFQDLEPKLRALLSLLNTHISPTRLLERIEQTTLPTVQYNLFTLTPDRKVSLGVVTDSFESAAEQVVAYQRSGFVKKVDATGYTALYGTEGIAVPSAVQYQMTLTLTDDAMTTPVTP